VAADAPVEVPSDPPDMRHDDALGEDVSLEEADNVRDVVMQTACPAPRLRSALGRASG
jgi:hypothetical protein